MVCARSLRWCCVALLVVSASAAAQRYPRDGECDWYCWVEERIDSLQAQIDWISKFLFQDTQGGPRPPTDLKPSTSENVVSSTFGTPSIPTNLPNNNANPTTPAIVTVSSTASSYPSQTNSPIKPSPNIDSHAGFRSLAYFGNWDIYARKFFPQQIPADKLTHLLYSFADNKPDGTVFLTDSYADTEIHYAGDSWNDVGKNAYGAVKQLAILKRANRNLKVLLSVGGWTYTNEKKHMDAPAATDAGRKLFAASCVQLIRDCGFDGIDVDWEYPQDAAQGALFLALLREIRAQLDAYADTLVYGDGSGRRIKPRFLLSIAAPAGATNYRNMPLGDVAGVLDFVNLMAYDYAGSWDKTSGHSANLYPSLSNPKATPYNTQSVVAAYLAAGVPASKLNIGMPLYGRSFTSTSGLGQPYNGIGKGSWEAGVYDFKDLPLPGDKEYYDAEAGASYSYNNETGMLVSYDTVGMALKKADFIKKNRLGGAMWWEVAGDRVGKESIISNVVQSLGGDAGFGIESSPNWLLYPDSQYANIKSGSGKRKMRR